MRQLRLLLIKNNCTSDFGPSRPGARHREITLKNKHYYVFNAAFKNGNDTSYSQLRNAFIF